MRRTLVLALAGALALALSAPSAAQDPEGVTQEIDVGANGRYRPFGFNQKWRSPDVTYGFVNYSPDLPPAAQRQIVAQAFRAWSDASSLRFVRVRDCGRPLGHRLCRRPQVRIQFVNRSTYAAGVTTRRPWPFGILGIAQSPPSGGVVPTGYTTMSGDIQLLDLGQRWTVDTIRGEDQFPLLPIVMHEIGHAVGLAHTQPARCPFFAAPNASPVMCPTAYADVDPDGNAEFSTRLHADDIRGIRSLYGNYR